MASLPYACAESAALLCSDLFDDLSRFELELLSNQYVKERHPILLLAIAQARSSALSGIPMRAHGASNSFSHSSGASNLSASSVAAEIALLHAVQGFGLVAQANDITGYLTWLSLRATSSALHAASHAGLAGDAAAAALAAAVHSATHTRFELTDAATDELVYIAIIEVLEACLLHCAANRLPAPVVSDTAVAILRTAVDGSHARSVRQRAQTALNSIVLHLSRATVAVGSASELSAAQVAVAHLLDGCCDIIGVPQIDVDVQVPLPAAAAAGNFNAGGGDAIDENADAVGQDVPASISLREPFLPLGCLLHTCGPVQVTDDLSSHLRCGSGPDGGSGISIRVSWSSTSRRPSLSSTSSASSTSSDPSKLDAENAVPSAAGSNGAASAASASEMAGGRLTSVADGAVFLSLSLITRLLQVLLAPVPGIVSSDGTAPVSAASTAAALMRSHPVFRQRIIETIRARVCLALVWLGDGVGPDPAAMPQTPHDEHNAGQPGLLASMFGGGSSSSSNAPMSAGAKAAAGASAAVSMRLPQLPLYSSVLRLLTLLHSCDSLRPLLTLQMEQILLRVVVRAATAPARLALACAVYLGLPSMRLVLAHLTDAQRIRDAAARQAGHVQQKNGNPSDGPSGIGASAASSSSSSSSGSFGAHASSSSLEAALSLNAATVSPQEQALMVKSIMASLSSRDLVFAADADTVRTLVQLLSPRSPLLTVASAAVDCLFALTSHPTFAADAMLHFDAAEGRQDVLRCIVQTLSSVALAHAHVHTLHGTVVVGHTPGTAGGSAVNTAGGDASGLGGSSSTALQLPLPETLRHRASACLFAMLHIFAGQVSKESIAALSQAPEQVFGDFQNARSRAGSSFSHGSSNDGARAGAAGAAGHDNDGSNAQPAVSPLELALDKLRTNLRRKRLLQSCARAFNAKPKRGVEAMRATGLLPAPPAPSNAASSTGSGAATLSASGLGSAGSGGGSGTGATTAGAGSSLTVPLSASSSAAAQSASMHAAVASLLRQYSAAAGFDPIALGEYLGTGDTHDDDAKRRAHVHAYVADIQGRSLVSALRAYLRAFRLPGEAQQIDRVLQAFAGVAHASCREGSFLASIDATYLLAFSIIMLNTDLHNPNIRPDRKMSIDAFIRNNTYYSDEICHGRRTPEHVLREIYYEIRDHPIAPPPATHSLIPLMAPAVDAPLQAPGNTHASLSFAGSGDLLALADWDSMCATSSSSISNNHTSASSSTSGADREPASGSAALQAAWITALPEVWHACLRYALASFTASFREHGGSARSSLHHHRSHAHANYPGDGAAASHNSSSTNGDAEGNCVKAAARMHMRSLATCASLAAEYGMASGVDIVVAALCRIAAHSLRSPYARAAADAGSVGGGMHHAPSYLVSIAAGHGRHNSLSLLLGGTDGYDLNGTGSSSPGSITPMSQAGGGGAGVGRGVATRQRSLSPAGIAGAGSLPPPRVASPDLNILQQQQRVRSGPDHLARQGSSASVSSTSVGATPVPAPGPAVIRKVADDFASDLRAQMALSAAIAIAMPSAQGNALQATGWQWLFECLLRLARVGSLRIPEPGAAIGWDVSLAGTPAESDALGTALSAAAVAAAASAGSSVQDTDQASFGHLLQAYAMASAQHRYLQRKKRAAVLRSMAEAALAMDGASSAVAAGGGGDGLDGTGMLGAAGAPVPGSPAGRGAVEGLGSPSRTAATAAAGANGIGSTEDASGGGGGIRSMLFGWLFGSPTEHESEPSPDRNQSLTASNRGSNSGGVGGYRLPGPEEEDDIATGGSPEWTEIIEEESEDDEGGSSASAHNNDGRGAADDPDAEGDGAGAAVGPRRSLFGFGGSSPAVPNGSKRASHDTRRLMMKASVDAVGTNALALLRSAGKLQPAAFARLLNVLLRLGGYSPASDTHHHHQGHLHVLQPGHSRPHSHGHGYSHLSNLIISRSALDDGSAFISGMESARYKCALLPPPAEHSPASLLSRTSLTLHASTCGYNSGNWQLWFHGMQRFVSASVADACAPTRRLRQIVDQYLALCVGLLLQHAAGIDASGAGSTADNTTTRHLTQSILQSLHMLVHAAPPVSGAVRLQVAAFLARFATGCGQASTAMLQALVAAGDSTVAGDVEHALLVASPSGTAAAHGSGGRPALGASLHKEHVHRAAAPNLLLQVLRACTLPGWSDDDATSDDASVSAADEPAGLPLTAHVTASTAHLGADNSHMISAASAVGSPSGAAAASLQPEDDEGGDDLHVLELTLAASTRLTLDVVRGLISTPGPPPSASQASTMSPQLPRAFVEQLIAFLPQLCSHTPNTSTITMDESAAAAVGLLTHLGASLLVHSDTVGSDDTLGWQALSSAASYCVDPRPMVRLHATEVLQSVLLQLQSSSSQAQAAPEQHGGGALVPATPLCQRVVLELALPIAAAVLTAAVQQPVEAGAQPQNPNEEIAMLGELVQESIIMSVVAADGSVTAPAASSVGAAVGSTSHVPTHVVKLLSLAGIRVNGRGADTESEHTASVDRQAAASSPSPAHNPYLRDPSHAYGQNHAASSPAAALGHPPTVSTTSSAVSPHRHSMYQQPGGSGSGGGAGVHILVPASPLFSPVAPGFRGMHGLSPTPIPAHPRAHPRFSVSTDGNTAPDAPIVMASINEPGMEAGNAYEASSSAAVDVVQPVSPPTAVVQPGAAGLDAGAIDGDAVAAAAPSTPGPGVEAALSPPAATTVLINQPSQAQTSNANQHHQHSSSSPSQQLSPVILCERTLYAVVSMVSKVFLHALPSLAADAKADLLQADKFMHRLGAGSNEGAAADHNGAGARIQNARVPYLLRVWRPLITLLELTLTAAVTAAPAAPSLCESLRETGRNVLLVCAAELQPPSSSVPSSSGVADAGVSADRSETATSAAAAYGADLLAALLEDVSATDMVRFIATSSGIAIGGATSAGGSTSNHHGHDAADNVVAAAPVAPA